MGTANDTPLLSGRLVHSSIGFDEKGDLRSAIPFVSGAAVDSRGGSRFTVRGLPEVTQYFSDPAVCLDTVSQARWPDGPACPRCDCQKLSFLKTRGIWACLGCRKQFSVKVGTIFEDSAISLGKWLTAMWLVANCNNVSSYAAARDLDRKSTRLNSSHLVISYAVFCLKKKKQ